MSGRSAALLIVVILFIAAGACSKEGPDPADRAAEMKPGEDCLINAGPCGGGIEREGITVGFDIQPKPVLPMREHMFMVTLKEKGDPVEDASVSVDLTMPGMFMGINRPVLVHTVNGIYEGKGIIQACPHGGKTWRADVNITRQGGTASVSFTFEVE